jgi:hypothetical protein
MKSREPLEADEAKQKSGVIALVLGWLVGCLLFVPLWAGLNFAFGTALDGPIGAFVMESPCQRLAGTTESLSRYTLSKGKGRLSSSVCHFASGPIRVSDRPTDGLGFTGREFVYLMIGFAGYAVCLVGAMVLAVFFVRAGGRLVALARGKAKV